MCNVSQTPKNTHNSSDQVLRVSRRKRLHVTPTKLHPGRPSCTWTRKLSAGRWRRKPPAYRESTNRCCIDNHIITTRCKYFDPCYARATVVRARFLSAAFSDGSYLAHVNGTYLRHVTFCIVRGPPLFIVSPISERGSRAAAHLTCRGTPASPILAVM